MFFSSLSKDHIQRRNLDRFRTLPPTYPGNPDSDNEFQLLDDDVIGAATKKLTVQEVEDDPAWMDESTTLVTSNLRYSDKDYPNAFGNFGQGGCAQVLCNGNVEWGVANGTKCKFVSLAWNNVDDIDRVLQPLASISARCGSVIELSCAPDFIIVKLVTQTGDAIPATTWLTENNLENNWKSGVDGRKERKSSIVITIGVVSSNQNKYRIKLARTLIPKTVEIKYSQLAVELALVMTVWKAQGATLQGFCSTFKYGWSTQMATGSSLRRDITCEICSSFALPSTVTGFLEKSVKRLLPNPDTAKWRVDVRSDGYRCPQNHNS
ncbi:hypothetical protein GQ600_20449 [Phytophthora cactorum]|nr:hypothetical protein GQ600_20449 [Phytophthora cactorum]